MASNLGDVLGSMAKFFYDHWNTKVYLRRVPSQPEIPSLYFPPP